MIRHKIIFSAVSIVEKYFLSINYERSNAGNQRKKPSQLRKALFEN